jgi:hypothetical protein
MPLFLRLKLYIIGVDKGSIPRPPNWRSIYKQRKELVEVFK